MSADIKRRRANLVGNTASIVRNELATYAN